MTTPLYVTGGPRIDVDFDDVLASAGVLDRFAGDLEDMAGDVGRLMAVARANAVDAFAAHARQIDSDAAAVVAGLTGAGEAARDVAARAVRSMRAYAHVSGSGDGLFDNLVRGLARAAMAVGDVETGRLCQAGEQANDALPELADVLAPLLAGLELGYAALPDGRPVLRDLGPDTSPAATTPPRCVADLITALARRDSGRDGEISVSFVVGADGERRAIVDIPGTKSWDPLPNHDVTSVGTDARAIIGADTAYQDGVLQAMTRAGVTRTMPVLLVGHSEGGIVAVDAARDAVRSGRFAITHIVTAGSPIGLVAGSLPASVRVLALENTADLVPETDGAANPARPNVTTVRGYYQRGSIVANHDLGETYEVEARDVDASEDPEIGAFVDSAGGFLSGATETTEAYWIRRG